MNIMQNKAVIVKDIERDVLVLSSNGIKEYKKVKAKEYSFFASAKNEDIIMYKEMLEKEISEGTKDNKVPEDLLYASALTYKLLNEDWEFSNVSADLWMRLQVNSSVNNDIIVVDCDYLEHGLLAAYLIAKELNR